MAAPAIQLKPGFGPKLTTLLRRHGIPPAATIAGVAVLIALLGFAMVVVRPGGDPPGQVVHESAPVFNVLYDGDYLRPVEPRPGELVRVEGKRGRESAAVTVRRLELPPYPGADVAHGLLPAFAVGHIQRLRSAFEPFRLEQEGRARLGEAPGYEVAFRSGRLRASDVLLVPPEGEPGAPLLVSLRRELPRGRRTDAGRALSYRAKQAFRSFRYGRGRD